MITCSDLTKTYDGECVIDRFSGQFPESGLVLMLGESGSGKTTFLNLLAGFLPFEGGSIQWGEEVYTERVQHPAAVPFDYITQDSCFVDFLTVGDNLYLLGGGDYRSLLQRFGLEDKVASYPLILSGGERARLAVIRALLKGKRVLLLDEPTAALDEENKKTVFETLDNLKKEVLIFCATHDEAAIPYADVVLHFSKAEKTPWSEDRRKPCEPEIRKGTPEPEQEILVPSPQGNIDLPDPWPFLKKWFTSSRREQHAKWLYLVFLTVSVLLLLLGDTPAHKSAATGENMYRINTLDLRMTKGVQLSDLTFDRSETAEIVVDYRESCPTELDGFIWTLPENRDLFKLSDAVAYGTYYTKPEQVILSYEMAESMMHGQAERLIGKKISRTFFKLGEVELEIVGILRKLNRREMIYMNSCGAEYLPENYEALTYDNLVFVNAALFRDLTDDPGLYRDEGQRGFRFYFDSYAARTRFLRKHQAAFREQFCYLQSDVLHSIEEWEIPYLFWILLPLSVLTALFTLFFYAELNRMELVYNNSFLSVFEYAGHDRKRLLWEMTKTGTAEFLKLLGLALLLAGPAAIIGNLLNHRFLWVDFELFSWNIPLLAAYFVLMTALTVLLLTLRLRKVRLLNWYENLIRNRDVL
ncbi:MAG: ATP-binding cassette domain-containing protein [Lachnospiraceae bacterium]|nr:ATP-binding cassette domain-containing protein [Lachnospiraceae bacterium]